MIAFSEIQGQVLATIVNDGSINSTKKTSLNFPSEIGAKQIKNIRVREVLFIF